jgi:hypothetical protein
MTKLPLPLYLPNSLIRRTGGKIGGGGGGGAKHLPDFYIYQLPDQRVIGGLHPPHPHSLVRLWSLSTTVRDYFK